MRSELISAELYATPCVITEDSKRIHVSCGSHILTHSVKTGKLIESTEAILAKPTSLVSRGNKLIVSGDSCSKQIEFSRGSAAKVTPFSDFEVLCSFETLTVVSRQSSESGQVILATVDGDAAPVTIFTGVVSSVSCGKSLIAAVTGADRRTLFVFDVKSRSSREYLHRKPFSCTAVHPLEDQVATGDATGKIMRWSSELGQYKSLHHWHSVPVASLKYTSNGSVLLSGAEEGVVCVWTESASESKPQFIPRLGGPIAHLSVSKCNQFVAVSIKSNRIVIVDLFTRSVQSTINGTLHDSDGLTTVSAVPQQQSLVCISTQSHIQLFDIDSRKSVTRAPISVQERNHIPSTIRAQVKAEPWECRHVAVLAANEKNWFMMAALTRAGRRQQLVKVFASADAGLNWSLHTVCVGGHLDAIVGVEAVGTDSFVTASTDGTIKQWQLNAAESAWVVSKSASFKNKIPSFLTAGPEGLLVVGFDRFVTLWHPTSLVELTQSGLALSATAVFAGVLQDSTDLFTLSADGQVIVWDLKKLSPKATAQLESAGSVAAVFGDRLLVSGEDAAMHSVTFSEGRLVLEKIIVGVSRVESLVPRGSSVVVTGDQGRTILRLHQQASESKQAFRESEEAEVEDMDVSTDADLPETKTREGRKVFAPMASIVSKLFPLENGLDTIGSPEVQFELLMSRLVPTI